MNTHQMYLKKIADAQRLRKQDDPSTKTTQKLSVRERIIYTMRQTTDVPAFPVTARKLMNTVNRPDVNMGVITEIAKLDPGITAKLLKLASSPAFTGKPISSIDDALMMVGLDEVRKIASSISIINAFAHLHIKVNWELFWLHSLLTARLTERLANVYREINGREYLSGLLHDVGKLYMEHHFPQEFELIIFRSMTSHRGMYATEKQLFDVSHAEVSALLCEEWRLEEEISRSIRFHHEPNSELNKDLENPNTQTLLATCICVADKLANIHHANMEGSEDLNNVEIESLPEWQSLKQFTPRRNLTLDMPAEIAKAKEIIEAVKTSTSPK